MSVIVHQRQDVVSRFDVSVGILPKVRSKNIRIDILPVNSTNLFLSRRACSCNMPITWPSSCSAIPGNAHPNPKFSPWLRPMTVETSPTYDQHPSSWVDV